MSYVLEGLGGDFVCANGQEGSSTAARGVPYKCPQCDAVTERFGDGSRTANEKLTALRSRNRSKAKALRGAP